MIHAEIGTRGFGDVPQLVHKQFEDDLHEYAQLRLDSERVGRQHLPTTGLQAADLKLIVVVGSLGGT
jgi:hypothetical protein